MVVKPSASQIFLLEWGGGLFVCPFAERLVEYYECDGRLITLRQLQIKGGKRSRIEDSMEEFVDMLLRSGLGSNAAVPFKEVLRAAKKSWGGASARESSGDPDTPKGGAVVDNLENLFCSKTIAVCYKSVGLIAPNRDASLFLPKHFSTRFDSFTDLQNDASLGPEIDISFEPKTIRKFTVALMDLTNPLNRRKAAAAKIVQSAARRWQARTELARRRKGGAVGRDASCVTGPGGKPHTGQERRALLRDMARFGSENPRPPLYAGYQSTVPEESKV